MGALPEVSNCSSLPKDPTLTKSKSKLSIMTSRTSAKLQLPSPSRHCYLSGRSSSVTLHYKKRKSSRVAATVKEVQEDEVSTQTLATTDASPSPSRRRCTVRFSVAQIQEYSLTLGDHPLAENFPMSLDWGHTAVKEVALKSPSQQRKRSMVALTAKERLRRLAMVTGAPLRVLRNQEQQRQDLFEGSDDEDEYRKYFGDGESQEFCADDSDSDDEDEYDLVFLR